MKQSRSKTYLVSVIDWTYPRGKIIATRFVDGLAEVRKTYHDYTFYHLDKGTWSAYSGQLEIMAVKV